MFFFGKSILKMKISKFRKLFGFFFVKNSSAFFSIEMFFDQTIFEHFFQCFFCATSIRKFPRNPKIILRKPCGQPTDRVAGVPELTNLDGLKFPEDGKIHGFIVTSSLEAL